MKITGLLFLFIISINTAITQETTDIIATEQCQCIAQIDTKQQLFQQYNQLMDCALNSYKNHKAYVNKIVARYYQKEEITGKEVLLYHEEVFEKRMIDECESYRRIVKELLRLSN